MYLRGLNGLTIELAGGAGQGNYSNIAQIDAIISQGGRPKRPDGSYYTYQSFMGGTLLDGCPLNVILGQGWITSPDQQAALRAAGITQCLGSTAPAQVSVVAPQPAPIFSVSNAPVYQPGVSSGAPVQSFTSGGQAILPTGVQQPSAPIVISQAGAPPVLDYGTTPPPAPPGPGLTNQEMVMYALLAFAAISFLRR